MLNALDIKQAHNFKEVYQIIANKNFDPSKTMLAIDIDLTLTIANHPALDLPNYLQHKKIFERIIKGLSALEIEKMFTHGIMLAGQSILDPDSLDVVEKFKQQGFRPIGFTASIIGPLSGIKAIETMRTQTLDILGFKFKDALVQKKISLEEIPPYNNQVPMYYKGVLFANGGRAPHNKGDVITAFLKKTEQKPKVFIIIDDRRKNIEEIGQALKDYDPGIDVLGIEYTYAHGLTKGLLSAEEFERFWQTIRQQLVDAKDIK
tara:strand:- start:57063 stop:57848 length:786 start_codon:yes stop_codon:yes gene_type:complete